MVAIFKRICAIAALCVLCALSAAFAAEPDSENLRASSGEFSLLGSDTEGVRLGLGRGTSLSFRGQEYGSDDEREPDYRMYWAGLDHSFSDGVSLHGTYIMQDISEWSAPAYGSGAGSDNPAAWKLALDLSQEKLRFTSLWVEYAQLDAGFYLPPSESAVREFGSPLSGSGRNFYFAEDTSVWYLAARQQWNRRFSTFQRYAQYDENGPASARQWSLGMAYQYNPGLSFEISYDDQDGALDADNYTNKQVRIKTMITF